LIYKNEYAWPFRDPVTKEMAENYFEIIKKPIDLSIILRKIKEDKYENEIKLFEEDLLLMFDNCRKFNDKKTVYYKIANKLQDYSFTLIKSLPINDNDENNILDRVKNIF
jgi:transcriptional activator SPT7